jgi:hypothetical protein
MIALSRLRVAIIECAARVLPTALTPATDSDASYLPATLSRQWEEPLSFQANKR